MRQLSFYSSEACAPRVEDLAGLLCGTGHAVSFGRGTAAKISAVLDDEWRARALETACAQRAVHAESAHTDDGLPLVRTAFRVDLTGVASRWLRGTAKAVPSGFSLDGNTLRMWALSCGRAQPGGYLLGLDPHAPETHQPLAAALAAAGLPARLTGTPSEPTLRITGRRYLIRLAELVGPAPAGLDPQCWPCDLPKLVKR